MESKVLVSNRIQVGHNSNGPCGVEPLGKGTTMPFFRLAGFIEDEDEETVTIGGQTTTPQSI